MTPGDLAAIEARAAAATDGERMIRLDGFEPRDGTCDGCAESKHLVAAYSYPLWDSEPWLCAQCSADDEFDQRASADVLTLVAEVRRLTDERLAMERDRNHATVRAEAAEALVAEKDAEIRDLVDEGIRAALAAEKAAHGELRARVRGLAMDGRTAASLYGLRINEALWAALLDTDTTTTKESIQSAHHWSCVFPCGCDRPCCAPTDTTKEA